jgi:menaquinone-9 beta-reductase
MEFCEVAIVGAGPAGANCALELAQRGIFATVFDHSHPREKPCGGGILPSVIEKFPFIEQFPSKGAISSDFKLILSKNKQVIITDPRKAFNISRRYLDEGILNMAAQNGANLIKEKVVAVQKKKNFWQIKTTKRLLSTRIIVGADGVNSLVRRKTVGPISRENLALTYGYFATGVEKEISTIKFLDTIPGIIWILPRDNHSSIGIGSELRYGSQIRKLLDDFIASYCPHVKVISKYAASLPSAKDPDFFLHPCAGKNWILVGDAAGHVDPITGGGILYALWSGKLAAEVIERNDLKSYDNLWRKEYGNYLVERCRQRDLFYNPFVRELSIALHSPNSRFSFLK